MAKCGIPDFRFRITNRSPGHTTFQMFVGQPGHGGNAGTLTLTNEEYDMLAPALLAAGDMLAALEASDEALSHVAPPSTGPDDDADGWACIQVRDTNRRVLAAAHGVCHEL